jgi:hypothetical protein
MYQVCRLVLLAIDQDDEIDRECITDREEEECI